MEKLRRQVFDTIQIGNKRNLVSRIFDWVIVISIFANLFAIIFETFDEATPYMNLLRAVEFITTIIFLLLISIIVLNKVKNKERSMETINKAKKDMLDLEAITKNIETDYRPINIELTSYEQEQENNAIISYEELVSNKDKRIVNYDDNYESDSEISVKKVDLSDKIGKNAIPETKIEVTLMSYEKEEAFLKALRQLQSDLAR